jgi:hypothetical protein
MVKWGKKVKTEVQGSGNMSAGEKEIMNRIKVKFTGDFNLPTNPVTFEDAIKVKI